MPETETQADAIRQYALANRVMPWRESDGDVLTIRAGDLEREMGLQNVTPNVCNALEGRKFLALANLELVRRDGPHQSTTTTYHYRSTTSADGEASADDTTSADETTPADDATSADEGAASDVREMPSEPAPAEAESTASAQPAGDTAPADGTLAPAAATAQSRRELTGVVLSNKADKTITVRIERRVKHPVYGKFIRRSTKLAAHDEGNDCKEGDVVTIVETRPISKRKSWRLARIVESASV